MSSSDKEIMFIVNPNSRGGQTEKNWKKWEPLIDENLEYCYDFYFADGIQKGTELTKKAVDDGYDCIVGVGGEGTINEVINGIYQKDPSIPVGFIRSGTVNDFLSERVYDWPNDIMKQIDAINRGNLWTAPIAKVEGDETRYSLNIANAGIGAKVSYDASIKRKLTWIRGEFRYTLLAILNVLGWKNNPVTLSVDDKEIEGGMTLFMSGFSKQGGGFVTLPHAELFDKKMGYLFVKDFSKLKILRFLNTVKKGNHDESMEGIHMGHAERIKIDAEEPILFEVDGEPFSYDSTSINIEAIPEGIKIIDHR